MKKLCLALLFCSLISKADVVIFDDEIANGSITGATVTTNLSYEGTNSVYYSTTSGNLSVFKFDLTGKVEINTNRYLQMRINFDPVEGSAKLRRIQLITSAGTIYTYEGSTASYTVDGQPAVVNSGRIVFDEDLSTWQVLSLDMSALPGPLDTTQLRQVNLVFNDPVGAYVDDVRVVNTAPIPDADVVIFDDAIAKGDIQYATVTTNRAYKGTNSVYYSTTNANLSVFKFNLSGSVEIYTNRYLQMRINFDPEEGATKLRRIQVITSASTVYTYEGSTASYTVDGQPAVVSGSRILFDDDLDTWQGLTLDLSASPGPLDTTQLRQVNLVFNDPVGVYVDDVRVTATLFSAPVSKESSIVSLTMLSGNILEMIVNTQSPSTAYPKAVNSLIGGSIWSNIGHSVDGSVPFTVTNLDYSTQSGTNRVIYLQADAPSQFFRIDTE